MTPRKTLAALSVCATAAVVTGICTSASANPLAFAQLQLDLADTENKIAYARNYYNGAVEIYNNRVQRFPGLIVARLFRFAPAEFFAADQLRA